jgi:type IVB pilus formation R64 PilN family outer membrane protein
LMPSQQAKGSLVVDQRPWFGSNAVPMLNGSPLPGAYQRRNGLVLTFSEPVTLARAGQMIQSVTGIRVRQGQNVFNNAAAARGGELEGTFLPVDAEQVTGGRFVWQGRLSDLLDQLSDTFNADWHYDGRMIRFSDEVTRTFMLHALATEITTDDSLDGGDAGDGGTLPNLSLSSTSEFAIWDDIEEAIGVIIGTTGQASFSPATGGITVTGSPEVVRRVESYLKTQNERRLRRVAVAIKVLDVTLANNFNFQASLQGTIAAILDNVPGNAVMNNAGSVITISRNDPGSASFNPALANDELVSQLQLSEEIQRVSIAHSGAVVTLSDQPAPLQIGRQIAYLERVSSTAGDASQVSLEPGTVNEGLTMIALPRILDRDRILMRLSVSITDAEEPFATFTSGDLAIQLPEISTTGFLQNAYINSGETMILAGFERDQNSYDDTGAPGGLWTGGTRNTTRSRNVSVLLLTAEILPADGMTVIGQ